MSYRSDEGCIVPLLKFSVVFIVFVFVPAMLIAKIEILFEKPIERELQEEYQKQFDEQIGNDPFHCMDFHFFYLETDDEFEYNEDQSPIQIQKMSESVEAGDYASIKIKGKPETVYLIEVYYPSGRSDADGLNFQKTNKNGIASWEWKVGSNTSSGYHKIVITDGNEYLVTKFEVE